MDDVAFPFFFLFFLFPCGEKWRNHYNLPEIPMNFWKTEIEPKNCLSFFFCLSCRELFFFHRSSFSCSAFGQPAISVSAVSREGKREREREKDVVAEGMMARLKEQRLWHALMATWRS